MSAASRLVTAVLVTAGCVAACTSGGSSGPAPTISSEPFGQVEGNAVQRFTLANGHGMTVRILDYGGIVQSLEVPDKHGTKANVVLGFSTLDDYVAHNSPQGSGPYFGALVGRYANRIAKGTFSLGGNKYTVPVNNNGNALHGGTDGFDHKLWRATTKQSSTTASLELQYTSPAAEMGFPGTLVTSVTYTLDNDNKLTLAYHATTDTPTVVNLTNHTYWNLAGEGSGDVYAQQLTLNASHYTPTDASQIPTGEVLPVPGTPMDFTRATPIGARITEPDPQLLTGQGYDLNWVLDRPNPNDRKLIQAAKALDPASGRTLTVFTTQPGIQFYSGNFLTGTLVGTSHKTYRQGAGFALETQHFPDSPNHPAFPSTTVNPGQAYDQTTVYQLGTT